MPTQSVFQISQLYISTHDNISPPQIFPTKLPNFFGFLTNLKFSSINTSMLPPLITNRFRAQLSLNISLL